MYQAKENGTTVDLSKILTDAVQIELPKELSGDVADAIETGKKRSTTQEYTDEQNKLINDASKSSLATEDVEQYKQKLNEIGELTRDISNESNVLSNIEQYMPDNSEAYEAAQKDFELKKERLKLAEAELQRLEEELQLKAAVSSVASEYGLNEEELLIQTKQLQKAYKITAEEALRIAALNDRLNKGVKSLSENWEDWKKALKSSDKTTKDYAKAVVKVTKTRGELLGCTEDLELSEEFL